MRHIVIYASLNERALHQTATTVDDSLVTAALYILIFLHQTATGCHGTASCMCCISLYSYIKPQPYDSASRPRSAVYPYIPHQTATTRVLSIKNDGCISLYSYIKPQQFRSQVAAHLAVYPYIPTSNRNILRLQRYNVLLYILIFLHQTATIKLLISY